MNKHALLDTSKPPRPPPKVRQATESNAASTGMMSPWPSIKVMSSGGMDSTSEAKDATKLKTAGAPLSTLMVTKSFKPRIMTCLLQQEAHARAINDPSLRHSVDLREHFMEERKLRGKIRNVSELALSRAQSPAKHRKLFMHRLWQYQLGLDKAFDRVHVKAADIPKHCLLILATVGLFVGLRSSLMRLQNKRANKQTLCFLTNWPKLPERNVKS